MTRDSRQLVLRYDLAGVGVPIVVGAFVLLQAVFLGGMMVAWLDRRPLTVIGVIAAMLVLLAHLAGTDLYRSGRERRP